ncbi:lysophosphatidic acid receptor 6-like [Symphorus nematophorus]
MNTTMEYQLEPKPVYALVYGCIMTLGLPLNAVSLWILLRRHSLKSTNAIFMVNLAIADLLLIISFPLRIYFYATGTWPLGVVACILVKVLFFSNIQSSVIFITFISMDRLLAVVYPLRSRHLRTSSNAWKAAALIWLFVLVASIPESVCSYRLLKNYTESACFELHNYKTANIPAMAYFWIVLVLTMLAINIVCTSLVSMTIHRHLSNSARVNNKVNVILIFVMSFLMFTLCFLPVTVVLITQSTAIMPFVCLASANCCLDPLLYYFSLDAFWKKKEDVDLAREQ